MAATHPRQAPPPRARIQPFVEVCRQAPGVWHVYRSDMRSNVTPLMRAQEGMKWTQRGNGDGTNTIYGRWEPF